MKDPLQPTRCARMLAALAAPDRLRIVDFLREGPRTVSEIAKMLKGPIMNASHHLMVLRHAKIVRSERQGRFMVYSLCPSVLRTEEEDTAGPKHINLGCCRLELPEEKE